MDFSETLERAMAWAVQNKPEASIEHKAAFANSVAYLVTGAVGGYGGPSHREHLVTWSLGVVSSFNIGGHAITAVKPVGLPAPGEWELEAAIAHAAPLCFDPAEQYLNTLLQIHEREHCHDDDPEDLKVIRGK